MSRLIVLAVLLGAVAPAYPATWHVAKDGSGDFTVIQDAVDAAASGDTIAIGPGRYDEFTNGQWGTWNLAAVEDKGLTFVGAGADLTILGPAEYDDQSAVCIDVRAEGAVTRIRGFAFENVRLFGVVLSYSGRLEVDNCVFRNSDIGIFAEMGDGGWIRNCQFVDLFNSPSDHGINLYEPSVGVMIEQCTFERCAQGVGAYWSGCTDITVRDCQISDGVVGVGFVSGASGSVIDCTVRGMVNWGIAASGGGSMVVEGNVIDQTGATGLVLWHRFRFKPLSAQQPYHG
ncbi:MAG: right-handed parallel beta-helix repeat-containing protein [Candidatus Krumholzibacteriia bacterium]